MADPNPWKDNPWKAALENEAVTTFMLSEGNKDDPRKMLHDVINWHVAVALDPEVSSDAAKLLNAVPEQTLDTLTNLRVSVARVAQALGVDNDLGITDAPYEALVAKARSIDEGWNGLCALCVEKAEKLLDKP